ncbi:MAG TPA: amidohydrolase family protein [Pyrinomonadaceae bacterium]|nr:amidohydrolase family protein [Pyrinomonadaceae bacterium]
MRHSHRRLSHALAFAALSAACLWLAAPSGAQGGGGAGSQASTLGGGAGVSAYALTGARIVTVSGPVIERGTVVVRDGLIAAVGANVSAPPDARVIDGSGLTVYPGVIDANTTLGIPRPTPTPGGQGGGGFGLFGQTAPSAVSPNSPQPPGLQPELLAADIIRPGGGEIEAARNAGITAAQTAPRGNVFLGQSAVINLSGESPQQMLVRSPVAVYVGLSPLGQGQYPGSLMGVLSSVRQMLLDARRYKESNEVYERSPRGLRRPEQDKSLAALLPVLARQVPIVMQADREREIERALDIAQEFQIQMVINGGQEADRVAARLKAQNVPVLLSLNFPRRTSAPSPEADPEPLRVLRERVEAPKTAGRLAAAGVRFAFQSGGMTAMSDYLANAARAVESGLSRDEAVRALTLRPAEILGVSNQLGTIEVGKIANLTVTRGDIFDRNRRVVYVFIDGRPTEVRASATTAAAGGANASGTWALTVNLGGSANERQEFSVTLNLQQQGERLSGTVQGQLGTGQLANGTVTGSDVTFTVPVTLPAPASQTTDAIFTGTLNGNQMTGTVQIVGRGPGTFTGTRAGGPPAAAAPQGGGTTPPSAATGAAPSDSGGLSGTWALSASLGGQPISSTLTLEQQGSRLSGRISTDSFGAGEITDGSVSGNSFSFSTNLDIGGQSISLSYEGTFNGNQMSGTVQTPRGPLPFSGTRNP